MYAHVRLSVRDIYMCLSVHVLHVCRLLQMTYTAHFNLSSIASTETTNVFLNTIKSITYPCRFDNEITYTSRILKYISIEIHHVERSI